MKIVQYCEFDGDTADASIQKSIGLCQAEFYSWGDANQVAFDASKESTRILKWHGSAGTTFQLLGVLFDDRLSMCEAVAQVEADASWKLHALLHTCHY